MDLRTLKYFLAVYETASVSAAARRCFVSQPSISAAVTSLEQTLGCPLFIRHARGTLPTQEGDKLYPLAKQLTGSANAILDAFKEKPVAVPLRLGLKRSLGAGRMSLLLKELVAHMEELELILVDPEEPCDCRIVNAEQVQASEQFTPIWTDNYLLAIPRTMALSLKDDIELSDFEGLPFIHRNTCAALDELKDLLEPTGHRYQMRANIRTVEYAQALVSAGVGCALLPNWEEVSEHDDLVLKPIKGICLEQQVGLAWRNVREPSEAVQACIDVCQGFSRTS